MSRTTPTAARGIFGACLILGLATTARGRTPCASDAECAPPASCVDGRCAVPGTPTATRIEYRDLRSIWLPGIPILAGSYVLTVVVNAAVTPSDGRRIGLSLIPLAGPWALMSETPADYHGPLVVAGISQAVGLAMLIVGLTVERPMEVPLDGAESARFFAYPAAFGADGAGLTMGVRGF